MGAIISLALMLLLFWVLLVLPQRRRMQAQRALVSSVGVGDEIVTTAGLYGTVVDVEGDVFLLELADGVVVRSARWAVGQRVVPPEPESELDLDDDERDDPFADPTTDGAEASGTADPAGPADADDR